MKTNNQQPTTNNCARGAQNRSQEPGVRSQEHKQGVHGNPETNNQQPTTNNRARRAHTGEALPELLPVWWDGDGPAMLDQTLLPHEETVIRPGTLAELEEAICSLRVRGAPAIGIAAALGTAGLALSCDAVDSRSLVNEVERITARLAATRPTAVNLFRALDRMRCRAKTAVSLGLDEIRQALLDEALMIQREEIEACHRIGAFGAGLVPAGGGVLNHCNAGALATGGYGTSLGVLRQAWREGTSFIAYVDETRPLLQGARLTAWELEREGIPVVLICDNMAGHMMKTGRINAVIVGADRIAANGDTANKIGTYATAVLARYHNIPFYVAAPVSTFDLSLSDGASIPIEERHPDEVRGFGTCRTAPPGVPAANPAFDVTPAELISAIITDKGLIKHPDRASIAAVIGGG
ncbi:MAG: S-methyl-5-thioribose-1-phosphate isomerase [bacterium]|nr:S-methyl-5-thioribose-1-phosphate isomerase [bacterium]